MDRVKHSFTSRRPAAGTLPDHFQLPPVNPPLDTHQVPSMAYPNYYIPSPPPTSPPPESPKKNSVADPNYYIASPPRTAPPSESLHNNSVADLQHHYPSLAESKPLTMSSGVTGIDLSPLSSGVNSSSSQSSQAGISPYHPNGTNGSWATPVNAAYTFGTMTHAGQPGLLQQPNYPRGLYSPNGGGYNPRSSQSPATTDHLAAPPYDQVGHPFPMSMSGGGAGHTSMLSQQQSHQQSHQQPHQQSHQQSLHNSILGTQSSQPPTPSTSATSDNNYARAPPTPNYYGPPPSSTPQQTSFSTYAPTHHSPQQPSPTTTGAISRAIPALSSQHHSPMQAPPQYGTRPYAYGQLPPAMGGAVLSNMGNPGGQMSMMGGMNQMAHGFHHPAHHMGPHTIYAHGPTTNLQDRPFRCDTCPQSFNRNHDLKRHKRIHLAVKPFPCDHCDKAFSRKDALKRHRLVKGCGDKDGKPSPDSGNGNSPLDDLKSDPGNGVKEEHL